MSRIIIFNCPPRSGKDVIAQLLMERNESFRTRSFKDHLFNIALVVSGVPEDEWWERYETRKDEPWDKLGGLSQRQYLIKISEEWVKPVHGERYFGSMLAASIQDYGPYAYYAIPDGGFEHEVSPLIEKFGKKSILILQWSRFDFNFDNDSRNWITDYPDITIRLPDNNSTLEEHYNIVKGAIDEHFK